MSETSKYRKDLVKFCKGYGVDLGYGGDPIINSAITIDLPTPYTNFGNYPLNLGGDATKLQWFKENSLDFVYSSHLLEDFENTKEIIEEWSRILKLGGRLVLLLPDQKRYKENCLKRNEKSNPSHKIEDFSLNYMRNILRGLPYLKIIFEKDYLDDYNFALVAEKTESTPVHRKECDGLKENIKRLNSAMKYNKRIIEELMENVKKKEQELHEIRSSLRWKIPNYFYKLYKNVIGKF